MDLATAVADFFVALSFTEALSFTVAYHLYSGGTWIRDPMGRHIMAFVGVDGAVLALAVVRIIGGASLDTTWFAWSRLIVFAGVPWVLGWRLVILVKFWRKRNEAA